jgi:hypothetical protein
MKQNMDQSNIMLNAFLTGTNGLINTYVSVNKEKEDTLPPPAAGVPTVASLAAA